MRAKMMAGVPLRNFPTPVDGQINYSPVFGRRVEFRFSVLPTIHGNKVVMRLLEKRNQNVGLEKIGLQPSDPRSGEEKHRGAERVDPRYRARPAPERPRRSTPSSPCSTTTSAAW